MRLNNTYGFGYKHIILKVNKNKDDDELREELIALIEDQYLNNFCNWSLLDNLKIDIDKTEIIEEELKEYADI